jgi:hypothetical protein
MTLNAEQANHNNEELYNCAIQEEILAAATAAKPAH